MNGARGRWRVLVPLLLVVAAELVFFNLPAWQSLAFPAQRRVDVIAGAGVRVEGDRYTVTSSSPDDAVLSVDPGGWGDIRSVTLDLEGGGMRHGIPTAGRTLTVTPLLVDEGHATGGIRLHEAHVSEGLEATHHIRLHPAGRVRSIRLYLAGGRGLSFTLRSVRVNARVPLHVSALRLACLLAAAYLAYAFLPSRAMYRWRLDLTQPRQRIRLGLLLAAGSLALAASTQLILPARLYASTYTTGGGAFLNDANQYDHLADAFLAGRVWLDLPVPDWLAVTPTPYDTGLRALMAHRTGQPSYWDYAFHDGRYYSYFGPLPALLLYAPFKLATGRDLRTDHAVALLAVLALWAIAYFLHALLRSRLPHATLGLYLLAVLGLAAGSGLLTQTYLPKVYSPPVLAALALTLTGLGLWLDAARPGRMPVRAGIALGSLCIALDLACRPQSVLAALLAAPVLAPLAARRPRRALPGDALCLAGPFAAAGAAMMAYNQARFGSPFDFGAAYNLTGFDLTHLDASPTRLAWGLWVYLLQPAVVSPNYPFLKRADDVAMYMGATPMEPMYGGLAALAPTTLLLALLPWARRRTRHARAWPLTAGLLLLALAITLIDTRLSAFSSRYLTDLSWPVLAAATLTTGTLLEPDPPDASGDGAPDDGARAVLLRLLILLTLLTLLAACWSLLADGRYEELRTANNTLYRIVESWFLPLA